MSWKELLVRQLGSGKFWKNRSLFSFETDKYLNRSDAVTICKKAEIDTYSEIISNLTNRVDNLMIEELTNKLNKIKEEDISDLGM